MSNEISAGFWEELERQRAEELRIYKEKYAKELERLGEPLL